MKKLVLATVIIAALVAPAVSGRIIRIAAAAPASQTAPTCRNVQLLVQYKTSQGAAGHILNVYRIHNLSAQACALYGYPGAQLLDQRFVTLPTMVHRGLRIIPTRIPVRTVHVGAHGNAYFTLGYSDVPTGSGSCPNASYLMIWAPNNYLPVVTYAVPHGGSITACNGALDVSPVMAQPQF